MYLGHTNDLKLDEYTVLKQCNNRNVLVNSDGYKLVSNVCPHQESLISKCNGVGKRTCPYHGWTFQSDGTNLGSGTSQCKNTTPLDSNDTYIWNNLVFSKPFNIDYNVNLEHMQLVEQRVDSVASDYRNIVDLFLDVEHIPLIHRNVYDTIGLSKIQAVDWRYFDGGSLQIVDRNSNSFDQHLIESERQASAFWLCVYPNTMIEYQPGSLFVTVATSTNEVIVYKYRDTRYSDESYTINNTVWETAWQQDKEQAEMITVFTSKNLCDAKKHYRMSLNGGAL